MKINEIILEDNNPVYYWAYGMLTSPKHMGEAIKIGPATLRNFEFELLQFANVYSSPGSEVYGALWQVPRVFLSHLDKVEGYPTMYDRKQVPVYHQDKKVEAHVYFLTPAYREYFGGTVPGKSYVRTLFTGYKYFGLPTSQIGNALQVSLDNAQISAQK